MSRKIIHGMWIGLVLLLLGVVVMAASASQGTASPVAAQGTDRYSRCCYYGYCTHGRR